MKRSFALYAAFIPFLVLLAQACGTKEEGALPGPNDIVAVDEPPTLTQIPPPTYPQEARNLEVQGTVMVRALVGKNGKVMDAFVVESPSDFLSDAAVAAAKQAVFKPAKQGGKCVAVWVQIPMRFSLDDGAEVKKGISDET